MFSLRSIGVQNIYVSTLRGETIYFTPSELSALLLSKVYPRMNEAKVFRRSRCTLIEA